VKAGVYTGAGMLEVRDWPDPEPGPGELVVRVRGCGLCGSDILKMTSPETRAPAVFGHEVVGEIAMVGPGVDRFAVGQRIVAAHHVPCFACHYCRRDSPSMCREFKRINLDPGGFAELCRVPVPNVDHATFGLPDTMSDETASFTEPLACCLRAVKRCRVEAGDSVVVVGLGSIGCLLVQAFQLAGATTFGADLDPARRALGRRAGARVPDSDSGLDGEISRVTAGRGADVVMLTAGGAALLPWALAELYHRELTLSATYSSSPAELRQAFELLSGRQVTVDGLITHRLPLAELARGVELMRRREAVKVYITL
jgi:L-iditol 2-dehydrogenase